jgi:CHAT domain-containing protein
MLDFNSIADRSGLIVLKADGKISQNSSTVMADASDTKAGRILLQANGVDDAGGIYIYNSKILARYGAGNGDILLTSFGGIKLDRSTIDASSNRNPIHNGKTHELVKNELLPYAFRAGAIQLNNYSSDSIQILDTSIFARQSKDGGGLENPLFRIDAFPNQAYEGLYGFYGGEFIFTIGYDAGSGGFISLFSTGGITINNSFIDVSSGEFPYDNIAGQISIADQGVTGIDLFNTSLGAMAGTSRDPSIQYTNPGMIDITARNMIRLNSSSILANNLSSSDTLSNPYPSIFIYSENGSLSLFKSELKSNYTLKPLLESVEYYGNNLFPVPILNEQTSLDPPLLEFNDGVSTDTIFQFRIDETSYFLKAAQTAYGATTTKSFDNQNPNLIPGQFQPTNPIQFNHSLASDNSQSVSILIDQNSASSQFLESQNRTLLETSKALGLPTGSGKLRSIAELQQRLTLASKLAPSLDLSARLKLSPGLIESQPKTINTSIRPYTPAIVHLQRNDEASGQTRITAILLTAQGEPISRSTRVARADLDSWIKGFQRQLSRRSPQPDPIADPGEPLAKALINPLLPLLRAQGVTALLLEVDRGLQAVPYGALPVEGRPLGDLFALTITPSLGLIELDPGQRAYRGQMLLAGASQFSNGLAPLPMVRQELQALAQEHSSQLLLDGSFTPTALIDQALGSQVSQLHIATHANFLPGQTGVIYTPTTTLSLADLGRRLRSRNSSYPLDLISMSACLTALGDEQSELGFVGMALQAGARSGLGTLWEVDDTATAAFFIELYRFLKVGLTKDQALQATQQAFRLGQVRLQGDRLVGPDPRTGQAESVLVAGLSREEQILFAQGLNHPYYWAGMILTGSPW